MSNQRTQEDYQNGTLDELPFMVVGEKGARSLDAAEEVTTRMDNLAVADEMEKAGKDALIIKAATGWERGADGKWRYEVEDFRLSSKLHKLLNESHGMNLTRKS